MPPICRVWNRFVCCALIAGSLAGAAVAAESDHPASAAGATTPPVSAQAAREWLARIQQASGKRNFQGTFVVSAGGALTSARMTHYAVGDSQYEMIESLDGQARVVYRHDNLIQTIWPQSKVALIEQREKLRSFPALLQAGDVQIVEFYEVRLLGSDRVAGRSADVLSITPRDSLRFGNRLWSDKETGLLLRADVLNERGQLLESSAFSDVSIGGRAQIDGLLLAMKKLDGYRVLRPTLTPTELEREGWVQRHMVPGFRRISCIKRPLPGVDSVDSQSSAAEVLQAVYSDGLTYVSVFIEPYDAQRHPSEVLASIGATHTLMMRQGDWWLTVVGDVPAAALRAFAKSVGRKP